MDLFNLIFVIIPLYCIVDGVMMLVRGNYAEKQLQRYERFTEESVQKSVKPNAILYIVLGAVFSIWNLVDMGNINVPVWVDVLLIVLIAILLVAVVVFNKKMLVVKPGYIGSTKRR